MDALSDVLKSIHLEGAVYLNVEFTAPWCVQSRFGLACIRERLASAEHVMFFHYLMEGRCKLRLDGGTEVIEASAGDCGYLACNRSIGRPMIEGLPGMVRIPVGDGPGVAPMRELLQMGVRESSASRPGAASMLAKLSELLETRETVIRIAERSGYESEAAFNRAFKREFGTPPASWRRARR